VRPVAKNENRELANMAVVEKHLGFAVALDHDGVLDLVHVFAPDVGVADKLR
jgi:hypothetical protein